MTCNNTTKCNRFNATFDKASTKVLPSGRCWFDASKLWDGDTRKCVLNTLHIFLALQQIIDQHMRNGNISPPTLMQYTGAKYRYFDNKNNVLPANLTPERWSFRVPRNDAGKLTGQRRGSLLWDNGRHQCEESYVERLAIFNRAKK